MCDKIGIVVEGGGHRGIYAAGVLDVLLENNIFVDGIIGVSAGAIHAASYVSGQNGRSIRYTTRFCRDKRYMSLRSLITTGNFFNVDFCYEQLPKTLDPFDNATFESSAIKYYVTCTDVESGKAIYHQCKTLQGDEMKWLQASASMPLASKIVEVAGHKMLDGGIADSIPLKEFEKMGYKKNIVILTQSETYQKKKNSLLPLIKLTMKKYPQLISAMEVRHIVYNETLMYIKECENANSVFVFRPSQNFDVSRTEKDAKKIRSLYELGREDAIKKINELRKFL